MNPRFPKSSGLEEWLASPKVKEWLASPEVVALIEKQRAHAASVWMPQTADEWLWFHEELIPEDEIPEDDGWTPPTVAAEFSPKDRPTLVEADLAAAPPLDETAERYTHLLDQLSADDRALFDLLVEHHPVRPSSQLVAEKLGLPTPGAARVRVHRLLQTLKSLRA